MSIEVVTFGCRLNTAESETLRRIERQPMVEQQEREQRKNDWQFQGNFGIIGLVKNFVGGDKEEKKTRREE